MGSSSKKGPKLQGPVAPPTGKMAKGPGFTGTNAFYEPGQALPAQGGLVRPTAIPGQPQGIGLNFVQPGSGGGDRTMLAQAMARQGPMPGRWLDRLGVDPNRITHGRRGGWRESGSHGGGRG